VAKESIFHDGGDVVDLQFYEDVFMTCINNAEKKQHAENIKFLRDLYSLITDQLIARYVSDIDKQVDAIHFDHDRTKLIYKAYCLKQLHREELAVQVTDIALHVLAKLKESRARQIAADGLPLPVVKVDLDPGGAQIDDREEPRGFERWDPSTWLQ